MTMTEGPAVDGGTHVVVASCDSHVGPLLNEQLRPYCPKRYLEQFDDFAARYAASGMGQMLRDHPNLGLPGHHDAGAACATWTATASRARCSTTSA